jgi:hypothetical protein
MADLKKIADEHEILRIRRTWCFCRDQGDWQTMKTLFHPNATISISWYAGNLDGFIESSQKVFGLKKFGTRVKHWFGNYRLTIENNRAFLESDIEGRVRDYIGDNLLDLMFECRFFDRFEKRGDAWKIAQWTAVYDNDRISPVIPGSVPISFYEGLSLDEPDAATSAWRLFLAKTGRPIRPMILGGSNEEKALSHEISVWLQQG